MCLHCVCLVCAMGAVCEPLVPCMSRAYVVHLPCVCYALPYMQCVPNVPWVPSMCRVCAMCMQFVPLCVVRVPLVPRVWVECAVCVLYVRRVCSLGAECVPCVCRVCAVCVPCVCAMYRNAILIAIAEMHRETLSSIL